MTNSTIDDVFDRLDQWRHLPKYQLERRADIYFAVFLPVVLLARFKCEFNSIVIPEFPLKKDGNYQSTNVDYLALTVNYEGACLVELKTDMNSLERAQALRLKHAAGKGMSTLLSELDSVAEESKAKGKYSQLKKLLSELGVSRIKANVEIQSLYILPRKPDINTRPYLKGIEIITFEQFASSIKGRGPIAERFAESLERWASVEPGSP